MAGIVGSIKFRSESQPHAIAKDLYYLLYNSQNRGQASAKVITQMKNPGSEIYYYNNGVKYISLNNIEGENQLYCEFKNNGSVRELFNHKVLTDLYGDMGIGGVSNRKLETTASLPYRFKMVALCKDGYIMNHNEIKQFLESKDVPFKQESNESQIFTKLFHYHYLITKDGLDALKRCAEGYGDAPGIKGKYAAIAITDNTILAICNGRPLGYALFPDQIQITSESAGPWSIRDEMNASNFGNYWHDIKPGEILECSRNGTIRKTTFSNPLKMCSFEWAYFSRPDSNIHGKEVGAIHREIGKIMLPKIIETIKNGGGDIDSCVVVPVQSSGLWYAIGICESSNIPYIPALYLNKYNLKSFILDVQQDREMEVRLKHIPSVSMLKDKEVILVDDSIVRGTTMRIIIDLIKLKAEPKKVHVFAAFPEKRFNCPYVESKNDFLIADGKNAEEVAKLIHADTLTYGTHEVWISVLGPDSCYQCEQGWD